MSSSLSLRNLQIIVWPRLWFKTCHFYSYTCRCIGMYLYRKRPTKMQKVSLIILAFEKGAAEGFDFKCIFCTFIFNENRFSCINKDIRKGFGNDEGRRKRRWWTGKWRLMRWGAGLPVSEFASWNPIGSTAGRQLNSQLRVILTEF